MIGYVIDGIFRKKIKGSKHIFRKLNAIGFDYQTMRDVIIPTCKEIRVLDEETKTVYSVHPSVIGKVEEGKLKPNNGVVKQFEKDLQIFLPLVNFIKERN